MAIFQFSFAELLSFPILSLSNIHDAPYGHYVKTLTSPTKPSQGAILNFLKSENFIC